MEGITMDFSTVHGGTEGQLHFSTEELIEKLDSLSEKWEDRSAHIRQHLVDIYGYGDNLAWRSAFYDHVQSMVIRYRTTATKLVFAAIETSRQGRLPDRMFCKILVKEAIAARMLPFWGSSNH
jgi:hypothetical protein